jgi:signal transduction histidine kinase/CheY-like chemotaxis protein
MVGVLLFSFNKNFEKVWQTLLSLCFVVAGTGIIYMLLINQENIYYYGGLFLIFSAGYFFIKLRFFAATFSGILLLIIYNVGIGVFQTSYNIQFDDIVITNAFYISANIISSIALYNLELLERKDFFQRNLLIDQQDEISLANKNLESKINDRTKQLSEHNSKLIDEISKREIVEKELISAIEKAEQSNRLKTAFLNNMSHEIRTPLNGITGFLELLQESNLEEDDKQEYFSIINKSSQRLINTVTDIMEISKIEAKLLEVSENEVTINHMLNDLCDFFSLDANIKGLKLLRVPGLSDYESIVLTDNQKLNGILTNIIKNAIKFTHQGTVTFGYELKENILTFFVKDTGIGIPENRQQAIFNRFEQADIEDTRVYEGTGLGLAIAKSYVEALGGTIWLNSEEGIGTEFMFTIPYKTKQQQQKSNNKRQITSSKQPNLRELIVLIAEDEEVNTQFFKVIFSNVFKEVIYVENGEQAIEACRNNRNIDLVLMDIKMSIMNGYVATQEIRKFNKEIVIIAQTAFGLEGDKEKAIRAGCNDYIAKPINKSKFFEIIARYV